MKYIKVVLFSLMGVIAFQSCKKKNDDIKEGTTVIKGENPQDTTATVDTTVTGSNAVLFSVSVVDFANTNGNLRFALYSDEASYDDELNPLIGETLTITSQVLQLQYENIQAGTYAIAVLHDEDGNGDLNTNLLGIPTEGFGFSTNPGISIGKPSFDDVSFEIDGQNDQEIVVEVKYVL